MAGEKRKHEGQSPDADTLGYSDPSEDCCVCIETYPIRDLRSPCPCGKLWCQSCLAELFRRATKDLSQMPPSCCGGNGLTPGNYLIPLHYALSGLSTEEASTYRHRFDEWRSPVKIYCPDMRCSTLIADYQLDHYYTSPSSTASVNVVSEVACPKCDMKICVLCKQIQHPVPRCPPEDQLTLAVLKKGGYKRCPRCHTGVKRMHGCRVMVCICGETWCWRCGRPTDLYDHEICDHDELEMADVPDAMFSEYSEEIGPGGEVQLVPTAEAREEAIEAIADAATNDFHEHYLRSQALELHSADMLAARDRDDDDHFGQDPTGPDPALPAPPLYKLRV